jgi:DNA-binding CsgD family transcriptional regulator
VSRTRRRKVARPRAGKSVELTPRELEVLELFAEGFSTREIALTLWVSEETVKSHVKKVLDRLQARTRAHAVALAFRAGILKPESKET